MDRVMGHLEKWRTLIRRVRDIGFEGPILLVLSSAVLCRVLLTRGRQAGFASEGRGLQTVLSKTALFGCRLSSRGRFGLVGRLCRCAERLGTLCRGRIVLKLNLHDQIESKITVDNQLQQLTALTRSLAKFSFCCTFVTVGFAFER